MRRAGKKFTRSATTWVFILAMAAMAGTASISAARADETQAKTLFKAMSDYLAAQKAISFAYDSTLEVVTDQEQKLGLASSGTLTLNRPDKLHATRTGGFANVEMVYDGKTLTVLGKNANAVAKAEEPGTIDQLVDVLRKKYDRPVPAADLLMSDPYSELMPLVVDAKDLGSGVIRGVECDHLAFRTEEVDWQIWIARETVPIPAAMSSPVPRSRGPRNTPSMSGTGKLAMKLRPTVSAWRSRRVQRNSSQAMFPTLMSYPLCSRKKEHNDHVEAHRGYLTGRDRWRVLP